LSAQGVLTLVDNAAPARLREAYLRLRARDPATDVIVDVVRLADLPAGTTVILALKPPIGGDDLDWLNLNRPIVSDRRYNVVLWCEDDAAAVLARRAPDFFDWISARVDCPPAPAAYAVADVKAAILARACGIAWAGPGLEDTLAAVRPGRSLRRVPVASYQSMLEALTSREPGWLFLEGVDTEFHLRRLRWAMAESGRRVIVFRRSIEQTLPGWWTVHAEHVPITEAVHGLAAAGGTGRLAALTGLDPAACASALFLLRQGSETAHLEDLLVTTSDPYSALEDVARPLGWMEADALAEQPFGQISVALRHAFMSEAASYERDHDPIVSVLRKRGPAPKPWAKIGTKALDAGDFEVAIRWLTVALRSLPEDESRSQLPILMARGRAYEDAGDLVAARADLERAYHIVRTEGDATSAWDTPTIGMVAATLAKTLLELGELGQAREYLESALSLSTKLDDQTTAMLLEVLAMALMRQGDLAGARAHLERAISLRQRAFAPEDHISTAASMGLLGSVLVAQGDMDGARSYLERSLQLSERLGEHPMIVSMLRALASVHWRTGDLPGARTHLDRALAIQQVALGSDHPEVANTLVMLASVLAASGDLDGARANLEKALAIQQKTFGNDGQLFGATTRRELANALVATGDLTGAIENLQQALATLGRIFEGGDHPDIISTLSQLFRLQRLQRDLQRID